MFVVGTFDTSPTLNLNNLTNAHGRAIDFNGGGAIYISYLTSSIVLRVSVTNCTFLDNTFLDTSEPGYGGAIADNFHPLEVTNSTFSGNRALRGGAIDVYRGTLNVTNSTFSGNSADLRGGAINTDSGSANLKGTILAANHGGNCGEFLALADKGYNISDDNSCNFTATGSANDVHPMLGALGNDGGPSMTFALESGSSAINAIPHTDCTYLAGPKPCPTSGSIPNQLVCDQRGFIRPALGQTNCDIGAVECVAAPKLGVQRQ